MNWKELFIAKWKRKAKGCPAKSYAMPGNCIATAKECSYELCPFIHFQKEEKE